MNNFTDFERFYLAGKNLGLATRDMNKQHKSAVYKFVNESENVMSSLQLELMDTQWALRKLLRQNQNEVRILIAILRAHGINPESELSRRTESILSDESLSMTGKTIKMPTAQKNRKLWKKIQSLKD